MTPLSLRGGEALAIEHHEHARRPTSADYSQFEGVKCRMGKRRQISIHLPRWKIGYRAHAIADGHTKVVQLQKRLSRAAASPPGARRIYSQQSAADNGDGVPCRRMILRRSHSKHQGHLAQRGYLFIHDDLDRTDSITVSVRVAKIHHAGQNEWRVARTGPSGWRPGRIQGADRHPMRRGGATLRFSQGTQKQQQKGGGHKCEKTGSWGFCDASKQSTSSGHRRRRFME